MRDIANDSKSIRLEPSGTTFLEPEDNWLCRCDVWDVACRQW
jgi:hypothetical protein